MVSALPPSILLTLLRVSGPHEGFSLPQRSQMNSVGTKDLSFIYVVVGHISLTSLPTLRTRFMKRILLSWRKLSLCQTVSLLNLVIYFSAKPSFLLCFKLQHSLQCDISTSPKSQCLVSILQTIDASYCSNRNSKGRNDWPRCEMLTFSREATPTEGMILLQSLLKNFSRIYSHHTVIEKGVSTVHTALHPHKRKLHLMCHWPKWGIRARVSTSHTYGNKSTLFVKRLCGVVEPGPWSREGKGVT